MAASQSTPQAHRWIPERNKWSLSRRGLFLVLISVGLTVALRMNLDLLLRDTAPLLAFVLPVAISAALGGFYVGVLATGLSIFAGSYFFIVPIATFNVTEADDIARVVLFCVIGLIVSGVSDLMHREVARAVAAEREVAKRELLLQEANSRLQLTLDAAGAGTWNWDSTRDEITWSKTNYDLYGIDPTRNPVTKYRDWLEKLRPEDRVLAEEQVRQLLEPSGNETYRAEYRITHPQRGERWLLGLGRIDRDKQGRPRQILGINIDITERKQSEDREREARSDAERTNRLKDEFVATVSHELRTPLTSILGWSQLLKRMSHDPDKLDRGLDAIERNARALTQLVSDLLDVGRIVSGKLRLETSPIDLGAVTLAALETIRPIANSKGVRLETHLSAIDEPMICDPARIQQIVWNLVSNAIKFTPPDGRVDVFVSAHASWATISVRDTGVGIALEFLPHLFERFRQQDASSSRTHGGLGLGLAIVKHLVELHGGRVRAESLGLHRGATFTVDLPLASAIGTDTRSPPSEASRWAHGTTLGGLRVLLVEDERDTREFVQRVLEESSAEVLSTGSANEALEVIDDAHPDIVVSDIGMPDMDGYALMQTIRSRFATRHERPIPAVALTAFVRSEDRQRAFEAGYTEHVAKPVDPVILVMTVARLCGSSRGRVVAGQR